MVIGHARGNAQPAIGSIVFVHSLGADAINHFASDLGGRTQSLLQSDFDEPSEFDFALSDMLEPIVFSAQSANGPA